MKKAVFLDKDGTLIENVHYNADPGKVRLAPFATSALKQLQENGYLLIVITNQSGIALGFFTENDLQRVRAVICEMLEAEGVFLYDFYYCPHLPGAKLPAYATNCSCRKPAPGLLKRAAEEHDIDLANSWMIGDILDDVEAGNCAGCKTILIDNGNETEWVNGLKRAPGFVVENLKEAAAIILKNER